ncbi:MAG: tripartite tricarboxylate transporter substrate binding protein [Betaproteobacteria bacterium]|nr:tripartite tricarboxylate transporter substrate binding protein [Betaproteobacteria bacterium]
MGKLHHVVVAVSVLCASAALAQAPVAGPLTSYPTKSVRMLVGFAPGGGTDVIARIYAQRLSESLGQTFIVENRPGAGGTIATDFTAKAAPDGYTLLMTGIVHTTTATIYSKLPYDPVKDFTAITTVGLTPQCFVVHPSMPVKTLRELIALAKAKPGEVSYASAGNGTPMHVGMELFRSMAGIKLLHVPYNGAGPSTIAVLGGQIPVLSTSLPTAIPHARAGKLRILAVTTAQRTQLAPDYPTVAEAAGLPGYEAAVWYGLLAPAGMPQAVVNKLNAEIERQQQREVREQLATLGIDPYRLTPTDFAELIKSDVVKWRNVIRETGAKLD